MKKAVIITLYDDFNYGNKLQNYAVYKTISKYGINTINLKNNRHLNYDRNIIISYIKFILSKIKYYIKKRQTFGLRYYNVRKSKFKEFNKNIPTTKRYFNYFLLNRFNVYDYYIVGSDQVWNPYMALDDLTLLKKFNSGKKIAFSASYGVSELDEKIKKYIKDLICGFDCISVREDAGKKICDELTKSNNSIVMVDPTMMLKKEEWEVVIKKPECFNLKEKKYILISFFGKISDELREQIKEIAIQNELEIIYLYEKNSKWSSCGPSEFLYLEKNARLICTDSFHSAVFGIIFNTPILVCGRNGTKENMNSRIETLLKKFDLENRRYTGKLEKDYLKCDYTNAYKILAEERKKANDFLIRALDIEENKIEGK